MRRSLVFTLCLMSAVFVTTRTASAQTIGPFTWHLFPYCNTLVLTVTQVAGVFRVDGYDGQCGSTAAAVSGIAVLNANGTVDFGLTILTTPGVQPVGLNATINVGTLSGPWTDSQGNVGTFVPGPIDGPPPLPLGTSALTADNTEAIFVGLRTNKTTIGPEPIGSGNGIASFKGLAYDGAAFSTAAVVRVQSTQAWTTGGHGARLVFQTTPNGGIGTATRMVIDQDGQVGIGIAGADPADWLDVNGDIRIGTGTNGCVKDRDGTVLTGVCSSDARFKRDISSFEPMLTKVAALRPVHFYWRASEFPTRAFGANESYGLVAQEVEQVLPELVGTDADGYKTVNYSKLPLMVLEAIKELKAKNDALEAQNAAIERRLAELEARVKQ